MNCPHCGTKNSLHTERYTEDTVCWSCGYRECNRDVLMQSPGHSAGVDTLYARPQDLVKTSMQYRGKAK